MPERRRCTLHHIKDILSGHKKFFYNYQIKKVNVPKFKEFLSYSETVSQAWVQPK